MDIGHMIMVASSLLGIFFMLMTYTYVDKLEKIGCACSESKYRSYIKGYSVFLVIYMILTVVFPASVITDTFGMSGAMVYLTVRPLIQIATLVFIVISMIYIRDLVNKKCQCAEDVRRDILYIYYILEIIFISFSLLFGLFEIIAMSAVATSVNAAKFIDKADPVSTLSNPMKSLRKLPKNVSKVTASLKKTLSSPRKK